MHLFILFVVLYLYSCPALNDEVDSLTPTQSFFLRKFLSTDNSYFGSLCEDGTLCADHTEIDCATNDVVRHFCRHMCKLQSPCFFDNDGTCKDCNGDITIPPEGQLCSDSSPQYCCEETSKNQKENCDTETSQSTLIELESEKIHSRSLLGDTPDASCVSEGQDCTGNAKPCCGPPGHYICLNIQVGHRNSPKCGPCGECDPTVDICDSNVLQNCTTTTTSTTTPPDDSGDDDITSTTEPNTNTTDSGALSEEPNDSGNDGANMAVIGGVIGAVVVILLCCCLGYYFWDEAKVYAKPNEPTTNSNQQRITHRNPGDIDRQLDQALEITKVFVDLKLKIIRHIERAEIHKDNPSKTRWYNITMDQIENWKEELVRTLIEKYKDKERIERFKPRLEQIWEQARKGEYVHDNTYTTRPSIQAREFFRFFDFEGNGSMSLMEFTWVCQVVDNSLTTADIRVLFDFVSGDAQNVDEFRDQNVEEYLSNEYNINTLPHVFKQDLIKYLSTHNYEQAQKDLAPFYNTEKKKTESYDNNFMYAGNTNKRNAEDPYDRPDSPQEKRHPGEHANRFQNIEMENSGFPFHDDVTVVSEMSNTDSTMFHNTLRKFDEEEAQAQNNAVNMVLGNVGGNNLGVDNERGRGQSIESTGTAYTFNPHNRPRYSIESNMTTSTIATGYVPVKDVDFRSGLSNFQQAENDMAFDLIKEIDDGRH